MKLLVCGGRDYAARNVEFFALDRAHARKPITLIIHGACVDRKGNLRGADRWSEEWAIAHEVPYLGVPAKWSEHDDSAGPIRNQAMLDRYNPEGVLAMPGHNGTDDMVRRARKAGLPVWEPCKPDPGHD